MAIRNAILVLSIGIALLGIALQVGKKYTGKFYPKETPFYIIFYFLCLIAVFLHWLMINATIMLPDIPSTLKTMSFLYKWSLFTLNIATLVIIHIGFTHYRKFRPARRKGFYISLTLTIYGFLLLVLLFFTELEIIALEYNTPLFGFTGILSYTKELVGFYGFFIGIWFIFMSIKPIVKINPNIQKMIPYYSLYSGFPFMGGLFLIIIGITEILSNSIIATPCWRQIISTSVYISILWFPTAYWILQDLVNSRIGRLQALVERDKVRDLIDHDIANAIQIVETCIESLSVSGDVSSVLKRQFERLEKLIVESRDMVTGLDDQSVEKIMTEYKLLRVALEEKEKQS